MTHLEHVARSFVCKTHYHVENQRLAAAQLIPFLYVPNETVRYSGHNVWRSFFFRPCPLRGQKIHVRPDPCKGARYYNESSRKLKEGPLCILPRIHT